MSIYQAVESKRAEAGNLLLVCNNLRAKTGVQRLQAKIKSEISFLERLLKKPGEIKDGHLRSSNLSYLSAIVACVQSSDNVEEIMRPIYLQSLNGQEYHMTVDVVADYGKTWIKVVARNPYALLQSSLGAGGFGRRTLIEQIDDLKECSQLCPYLYQPPAIKVWFAVGVDIKMKLLLDKMNVDTIGTVLKSSSQEGNRDGSSEDKELEFPVEEMQNIRLFNEAKPHPDDSALDLEEHRNFSKNKSVLSLEEIPPDATLNLDVSTMIAQISALTNGFRNFVFQENILSKQAQWERTSPIRPELDALFQGRRLVCCETAYRDFQEILKTVGGMHEQQRAEKFLLKVIVVPDQPSSKVMALSIGGRVKTRSKIVFGTGDTLQAVTVTANQGFLRAAEAQGIQLVCFVHESRALTEAKEKTAQPVASDI